jgi:hypothetical protein
MRLVLPLYQFSRKVSIDGLFKELLLPSAYKAKDQDPGY